MYARVHTLETTPESHDEGLRIITEQLLPWARESTGFRGIVGLTDRAREITLLISLWEDEESLQASEPAGDELSKLTASVTGAVRRSLDDYEVTLFELI
jgi:hypothetical protein